MTAQKGAESNAESLDPADVPVNTFWLIEFEGKHYEARRIPWSFREHHWSFMRDGAPCSAKDAEVTLVSRLAPAPRVITNADELDRLPHNSVILSADNDAWQKSSETSMWASAWWATINGEPSMWASDRLCDEDHPATVLWEPGA